MVTRESTPLVLFSGLAADAAVFAPQKLAFPQLVVPKWPIPDGNESLADYSKRIAAGLRTNEPCVLGGASFGGIIALEVSQHLSTLAVVLIGSVRRPSELPLYARFARPLRFLVPWIPARLLQLLTALATLKLVSKITPHFSGLARQFRDCDPRVFKWSLRRILDWQVPPDIPCPVFHIHGDRDFVLPAKRTRPDQLVRGGGHVVSLTHSADVNSFLRQILDGVFDGSTEN